MLISLVLTMLLSGVEAEVPEVIAGTYGARDGYTLYFLYEDEPKRLSIRVFNIKKSEYENVKTILFTEARKISQVGSEVDLGDTAYTFLHKSGKISFRVEEKAIPGGVNIHLISGMNTEVVLVGKRFEASEK